VPKHRAAPVTTQPAALSAPSGPRHAAARRQPARAALRTTLTFTGLAAAATGVAVATGVVQSPSSAVSLADSLGPSAAKTGTSASADVQHRSVAVSRSSDRTQDRAEGGGSARSAQDRSQHRSRATDGSDRRAETDPAKRAALGLSSGPAVGGEENLSDQDPQSIAEALLPSYGFDSSQMSCLVPLWMGESGWRVDAENPSSGAYGIPQSLPGDKMATVASDWRTNPVTQIKWGLEYIRASYGSPCGAWDFKQSHGWY
jgi:hypothetical protein